MFSPESQLSSSLDHPSIRNLYVLPDCQIQSVTVFQDKAEVCRTVRPRVSAGEVTEILFKKLSPHLNKDSVRVEVKGNATIQDVSFHTRRLDEEEAEHQRAMLSLRDKLKREQRHFEALLVKRTRLEKQRAVLGSFADTLIGSDAEPGVGEPVTPITVPTPPPAPPTKHKDKDKDKAPPQPPPPPPPEHPPSDLSSRLSGLPFATRYDPKHMETMRGFFALYEDQAEKVDENLIGLREELEATDESIRELERSLRDAELRHDETLAREMTVLIESTETGQVEMNISYVVGNAWWTPSYDIRVYNNDASLKVVYYGQVVQATGEDWETPILNLSTALPGIGGTMPDLGVQTVRYRTDSKSASAGATGSVASGAAIRSKSTAGRGKSGRVSSVLMSPESSHVNTPTISRAASMRAQSVGPSPGPISRQPMFRTSILMDGSNSLAVPDSSSTTLQYSTSPNRLSICEQSPYDASADFYDNSSTVATLTRYNQAHRLEGTLPRGQDVVGGQSLPGSPQQPVTSTEYSVPRPPACIPCDQSPHRVTIGLANMMPTFEFVSVPKKSPHAYIKATMQNTSKFAFLSGPTNIYVDNNFIGKSHLGHVAPQEEFSCKLGVDPGLKIRYNPMYKYKEVSGSSGKTLVYTFRQVIEVRNEHERNVRVLVMDQLPTSGEDKIKIHLLEPVIKHPEKYDKNKPIRLNKSSIVEWDVDLQPGEQKELVLKYSIEHPATEEVAFFDN